MQNTFHFLTKEYQNGTISELGIPHHPHHGFFVSNWTKFDLFKNSAFNTPQAYQVHYIFQYLGPWFNFLFPRPVRYKFNSFSYFSG